MSDPEKKLYRVEVTHVVYVLAADKRDAGFLAERNLEHEGPEETHATLIEAPEQLDLEWRHARPYGCDDDKTCLQILMDTSEGKPAPKPEDPDQRNLFS